MNGLRDVYQRKIYALLRMNLAVNRMNKCTDETEKANALRWVNAWLTVSGIRQFKLDSRSKKQIGTPSHAGCG
jgi:hypothetical protein